MKKRGRIQKLMEPPGLNDVDSMNGSSDGICHRIAETAYELYDQRGEKMAMMWRIGSRLRRS